MPLLIQAETILPCPEHQGVLQGVVAPVEF